MGWQTIEARTNRYDHLGRRVQKITPAATHTYFYDGWMLVKEIVANVDDSRSVIEYHWGKDISGTIGGAGGVGGLLYVKINGAIYVPWYDAYGNVMGYYDAQGNVVAEYTYDAFGKLIASSGPMANVFSLRYSTKYFDPETEFYYYGYRFYSPELKRWITRDPIGEEGGVNLYEFCANEPISRYDVDGQSWLTCFGDCIEEWRLDWSDLLKYSNLLLAFNTLTPKTAKEQLWIKEGNSKYTTPISRAILRGQELALKLPHGPICSSLIGSLRNLRHFMRNPLLVGSGTIMAPLTVYEGFYDIGVMAYCSMHCCGGD